MGGRGSAGSIHGKRRIWRKKVRSGETGGVIKESSCNATHSFIHSLTWLQLLFFLANWDTQLLASVSLCRLFWGRHRSIRNKEKILMCLFYNYSYSLNRTSLADPFNSWIFALMKHNGWILTSFSEWRNPISISYSWWHFVRNCFWQQGHIVKKLWTNYIPKKYDDPTCLCSFQTLIPTFALRAKQNP